MFPAADVEKELENAVQSILQSNSRRKLIVAGPGTGKTTLFEKLLKFAPGDKSTRLVLTFITNLRDELEKALSELAEVSTLHGFCQFLLRKTPSIRAGLTSEFVCQPEMASLIKDDWSCLRGGPAPHFVALMRNLVGEEELNFYLDRGNYYDAVDFDDSVYRVATELSRNPEAIPNYDLVLIDEYQDFNRMEAGFIETIASRNPTVIAGDDDQALYSQLRGASWEHIRSLHNASDYEVFQLPFCMRCPEVIVGAANDVVSVARKLHKLEGRIDKPYKHYEPVKGADSKLYPKIRLVAASVQRKNANYFGMFIEAAIKDIPAEEIKQANEKGEPVVLIIGSIQYLRQIDEYLSKAGHGLISRHDRPSALTAERAFELLKKNPQSNLGWRIILDVRDKSLTASCVAKATNGTPLYQVIPEEFKNTVLAEVEEFSPTKTETQQAEEEKPEGMTIKLTSFEGAKGLSAQHVFLVGLQAGDLPRDAKNIQDLEICKFLVELTRTKKRCTMLWTKCFGSDWKQPSVFLDWIQSKRYESFSVDKNYWDRQK